MTGLGRLIDIIGMHDAATDIHFLAHALAWVSDPKMESYQGDPSLASSEAGTAMLDYHVSLRIELLEEAIAGRKRNLKPMGWSFRLLKYFQ